MAWKLVIFSAAAFAAGVFTLSAPSQGRDQAGPAVTLTRQIIDEKSILQAAPLFTLETSNSPASDHSDGIKRDIDTPSLQSRTSAYDLDVPYAEIEFGTPQLNTLMQTGHAEIALPGMAPVSLTLVKQDNNFGVNSLSVRHADNISTITRRGDQFFATLALPQGSYRIDGRGDTSRLYPHQILAQRAIRHEVDYRHVH